MCGSKDGVEAAFDWLKPLQMVPSTGRRCHSMAGDFWRFPLNSLLRADSLLLSILPALPGVFKLQGFRICSVQSLFANWRSLYGFGTASAGTPGPLAWGRQCRVLWVGAPEGAAGQVWALWAWRAGAGAAPSMPTNAVPPHFKRNAFAARVAAACMYQISSYLSNPGGFPESAVARPAPFPAPLPALLVLSVSLPFV